MSYPYGIPPYEPQYPCSSCGEMRTLRHLWMRAHKLVCYTCKRK
jgi:hypothetical protein